jgi:fatty acid amide hydrolase 2
VLRTVAGPDGADERCRAVKLSDPADVSLEGLPVVLPEKATVVPVSRELREARNRAAAALEAAGARVERAPMRSLRRAVDYYLAALQHGAGTSTRAMLDAEVEETARLSLHRIGYSAVRRRGPHTVATFLLLGAEAMAARIPERRTRRALAAGEALGREVQDAIGDGVILHAPHARVAPRHGRTVGRPWVVGPTALFNLAGVPVTQVPLGLGRAGLPVGVQVAAARDRDHVSIAVALALERAFGGWVPPPGPAGT